MIRGYANFQHYPANSHQSHIIVDCRLNIIFVNTFFSDLEGYFTRIGDFTWRVVSLDWIIGGDFGKKFRRIRKEDKLNYKI